MRISIYLRVTAFIILFLISCQSNEIYFSLETQEIKSSNSKGIRDIYIRNDSTNEYYHIEWQLQEQSPPIALKLNPLTEGYYISSGWKKIRLASATFKLNSNSLYIIERAEGDADSYEIQIITNDKGAIVSSESL